MRLSKWTTIVRDGEEIEVNVEFDATPIISATWFDPAEGGEVEITAVFVDGVAIQPPLTDDEMEKLTVEMAENLTDDDFPYDDPDDWRE